MRHNRQIFQADSPKRAKRFAVILWTALSIIILSVVLIVFSVLKNSQTHFPKAFDRFSYLQHLVKAEDSPILSKKDKATRKAIKKRPALGYLNNAQYNKKRVYKKQIRAAFYVNWDKQSFYSLKEHITQFNLVFPEWFFLSPTRDTIETKIDEKALLVMQHYKTDVVPILSNFINGEFRGDRVHRIIINPKKRKALISEIVTKLKRYGFKGVNIDFEDLVETTDEYLITFQRELYTELHRHNMIVTQDVIPGNIDYNLKELEKYNDYLLLMAYDQNSMMTQPGPVAAQNWIEGVLDSYGKDLPGEKTILCLAAYGYDWAEGRQGRPVTYQGALDKAHAAGAKVRFDTLTYNLDFKYIDNQNINHTVYFTDAASNFNAMRLAVEYGLAGTSMWRLGAEDPRIWKFYYQNLSSTELKAKKFNLESLSVIKPTQNLSYVGDGDILDVLAEPHQGRVNLRFDHNYSIIDNEEYITLPSCYLIRRIGIADKKMVLSFDDGPSKEYTPRILDILKREHVPAVFFMQGENIEVNLPLVERIYKAGYEIGNHTFTHPNVAEISDEKTDLELNATRRLLECITQHSTILFRPPYDADSEPRDYHDLLPVIRAKKQNYITVGESIDTRDWERGVSADSIFERVKRQVQNGNIILMHDAGGNRNATIEALPRIIRYLKSQGYTFTTVSDLINQNHDFVMPKLDSDDLLLSRSDWYIANAVFLFIQVIFALFIVATVLSVFRLILLAVLAYVKKRKEKTYHELLPSVDTFCPRVSIIVPAYNEEVNIVSSVNNLLKTTYPDFEIVFVNDGSKDRTFEVAREAFGENPRVRLYDKENGGKASALNYGIEHSTGEIMVCIDADTQLQADAISYLIPHFADENVAAVSGNVKVGNEVNLLTRWQAIEYITSQNFDRRAFDLLNSITVVPGANGAFRKTALEEVGLYTTDTLAEDCDLTIRLLRKGYRVVNDPKAIAYTEAPETVNMFLRQRFRWNYGIMQCFWKHKDALFKMKHQWLGWAALPNLLFFQLLLPIIAPLADLITIIGLLMGNGSSLLWYYVLFLSVEMLSAAVAFSFEGESKKRLIWLIPQRFYYRQIMYYVAIKSLNKAIRGGVMHWGVLHRTGNVKMKQG